MLLCRKYKLLYMLELPDSRGLYYIAIYIIWCTFLPKSWLLFFLACLWTVEAKIAKQKPQIMNHCDSCVPWPLWRSEPLNLEIIESQWWINNALTNKQSKANPNTRIWAKLFLWLFFWEVTVTMSFYFHLDLVFLFNMWWNLK